LPVVPADPVVPPDPALPVVPADPVVPLVPPVPVASGPPSGTHAGLGVCTHVEEVGLQLSTVHALASSQSPSPTQHPGTAACAQEWVSSTQASVVQALVSPH
jgi:hypothetical protein